MVMKMKHNYSEQDLEICSCLGGNNHISIQFRVPTEIAAE